MAFIGIIGDQGSGKTALTTYWGYKAMKKGIKIIANYHLGCQKKGCVVSHPEFPYTHMGFDEIAKKPDAIEGAYVLMDELGVGADSYEFFTEKGKKLAQIITQTRKREAFIIYTVQRFNLINARMRAQTSQYILMEDMDKDIPHKNGYVCQGQFLMRTFDADYNLKGEQIFDGKKTWHLYDTRQKVYA